MMSSGVRKRLISSFKQLIEQITGDAMLFLACMAPILAGLFIKFGIPFAETLLTKQFEVTQILEPYYPIFDMFLAVSTPIMFCFVTSMVILGEIDDSITNYMAVTPLGKSGYLISRLGFPVGIAFFVNIVALLVFSLTSPNLIMIIGISGLSCMLGLIVSMMVVSISTNKVEGLAVTKLSGMFVIGIPVPFFITGNIQYMLIWLPSFWISKFVMERSISYFILCFCTSIVWISILFKRFNNKMI